MDNSQKSQATEDSSATETTRSTETIPARRFQTQEMAQMEVYGKHGRLLSKMGNVSCSGAFFEVISSDFVPKKNDLVRITVNLRSVNKTHIIDAEVVWSRGLGIGVQFLKRDEFNNRISKALKGSNA